jgi:hypothetical protein
MQKIKKKKKQKITHKKLTFSAIANLETKTQHRTNKLNFVRVHLFFVFQAILHFKKRTNRNKKKFLYIFFLYVRKIYFIHLNQKQKNKTEQQIYNKKIKLHFFLVFKNAC